MIWSRQHTALLLREYTNEVESSTILHQKHNPSGFILSFFKSKQLELDTSENLTWLRTDAYQYMN